MKEVKCAKCKKEFQIIEEVLLHFFENDDAYVVSKIVSSIREKLENPNFAKNACFGDVDGKSNV